MSDEEAPDIVRDDLAARRHLDVGSSSVKHFLPECNNKVYHERYRITEQLSHDELSKKRQEEQQDDFKIQDSLESWKERRRRKSEATRQRVAHIPAYSEEATKPASPRKASLNRERLAELARLYSTDEGESGAVCLDTESFTYSQEHSEPPEEPEEEPLKPVIKTSPAKTDPEHATMRNSGSYYHSAERVSNRTDVPPPTAAVKPQYRPVESLAAQLQRQNLAAEGVTGYKQFKNEFQNIDLNDTRSPIPEPSQFKQVRRKEFASKKALFETGPPAPSTQKVRESLPGPGHIHATREALFNSNPASQARPTSAERFRRDMRLAAVEGAAFPDPPAPSNPPKATHIASKPATSYSYQKPTISKTIASPLRSQSEVVTPKFAPPSPPQPARTQSAPEEQIYSENTICMNMKPGSSRGFGFQVRGGGGAASPIVVDSVKPGGAAHMCELSVGDEVLQMNGMTVSRLTQEQIIELMVEAVRTGLLRLRVRRINQPARKKKESAPSMSLSSGAKMVATEGGFYQIMADIPRKNSLRPQPTPSPAGTLDSGHESARSSPTHSPRGRMAAEEERWAQDLNEFESLERNHNAQIGFPEGRSWKNPSTARSRDDDDDLASVLAIEQEELEREIEDRERDREFRRQDEYTEESIRKIREEIFESGRNQGRQQHWMLEEADKRLRHQYYQNDMQRFRQVMEDPQMPKSQI